MALNTLKCNHLMPLSFKGSIIIDKQTYGYHRSVTYNNVPVLCDETIVHDTRAHQEMRYPNVT